MGQSRVGAAALGLLLAGPGTVWSQEVAVEGVVGHTGYEDLKRPTGIAGRIGLPWLGVEVAASWARSASTRRGIPCAGLIPLGSTDCVEQELDVTGTMTTASVSRPIPVAGQAVRLSAVPSVGLAAVEAERRGTETGRIIFSDRPMVRFGLATELRAPLDQGALGYSARVYGGSLLSSGTRCVDCFEPFRDSTFEARLSVGISYRWLR